MTDITKAYLQTQYGQVHYRISKGTSDQVLVMLHQTASSSLMFERLMTALPEFTIIAPDTPGYGASFDPVEKPSIQFYAEIVHEILLSKFKKCHIFGHHTGAAIAVQLVHDYPELVEKLILGGPPYLSDEQKQALKQSITGAAIPDDGSHLAKVWQRIQSRMLINDNDLLQREVLLTLRATRYHETYQAVFEQDFAGMLASIACPTLIVCGEHDTIRASAEPTHEAIKNSDLVIIPDAGTFMCDEHTAQVAAVMRQFLEK